jgi:hypothetical protein
MIFSIIYKKEIPSKNYEWYRFLKNCYFDIGGYEISLYEIENCILRNKIYFQSVYGEQPFKFGENDPRKNLALEKDNLLINFGIFYPTK